VHSCALRNVWSVLHSVVVYDTVHSGHSCACSSPKVFSTEGRNWLLFFFLRTCEILPPPGLDGRTPGWGAMGYDDSIEIFCACAPEDQKYLTQLMVHLSPLQKQYPVRVWERSQILSGKEWETEFKAHLSAAHIHLFLVSPFLLHIPFYIQALQQSLDGQNPVLPVLLRSTSVQGTVLEGLQCLPRNDRPLLLQRDRIEAFTEIVDEIKRLLWTSFALSPMSSAPRPAQPGGKTPAVRVLPLASDMLAATPAPSVPSAPARLAGKPPAEIALSPAPDFMAILVEPKLAQFRARARRHRRVWNRSLLITVGSSGMTCLFALADLVVQEISSSRLWQTLSTWLLFLAAGASLMCVLLLLFSRLYELQRWQYYQHWLAELSTEKQMYETGRGIYALVSNSQQIFIERVFQIIQHVGEGTRSADEIEKDRVQR
jgi:hypothetical protein